MKKVISKRFEVTNLTEVKIAGISKLLRNCSRKRIPSCDKKLCKVEK